MSDGVELYCGDCLKILPTLGSGSVDAVITDPPYGVNAAAWDKEAPYEVLPELLRISRGLVLWFGSGSRLPTDIASFGIAPQRVLIWHVTFSLSHVAAHGMFYRYHPIYAWNLPTTQRALQQDVVQMPQDGHNGWYHPGTKPIKLLDKLVSMTDKNAVILDPFMGSGTTGVACVRTGRRFIGMEICEEYFQIAERRIAEAQAQLALPMEAT